MLLRGASTRRHGSILQNNIPAEDQEMSSWLRKAASLAFGLQRATVNGVKISPKHKLFYRTQTRSTVKKMCHKLHFTYLNFLKMIWDDCLKASVPFFLSFPFRFSFFRWLFCLFLFLSFSFRAQRWYTMVHYLFFSISDRPQTESPALRALRREGANG